MSQSEHDDEPTAARLIRPVILAFLLVLTVIMMLVGLSVYQIDIASGERERALAEALVAAQTSVAPEAVASALRDAGFADARVIWAGEAGADEIVLPVTDANGLRHGLIAFAPFRPGLEVFVSTIPYKVPVALASGVVLLLVVMRLNRQTTLVTARRDLARQMALTDPLSGLPNRRAFGRELNRLEQEMLRAATPQAALYFIDLDGFKAINDTHGHPAGDALIQIVSNRLQGFISPSDVAARLSGDEFAILRRNVGQADEALAYGRSICKLLSLPYILDDGEVNAGASVGVALAHAEAVPEYTDFCRTADRALYEAKNSGRGRAVLFRYPEDIEQPASSREVA